MPTRKLARVLVYSVACVAALLVVTTGAVYAVSRHKLQRRFHVAVRAVAIPTTADALERGHHLAVTRGCTECHAQDGGGRTVIDSPAFGVFSGPNLTRGRGGLAADFSDADFVRAIRHGLAPDGRPLVLMPSRDYTGLSDEDLGALIAYLKSLPPVDRPNGPVAPGPIARALMTFGKIRFAADEIDHAAVPPASVPPTVSVAYGRYVAGACIGCHGANLSGGPIAGGPPDWPPAANLTPDPAMGIARWTEVQFRQAVRQQVRPDGSKLSPVMPAAFAHLTDVELGALWAYLRTLPPTPTGAR